MGHLVSKPPPHGYVDIPASVAPLNTSVTRTIFSCWKTRKTPARFPMPMCRRTCPTIATTLSAWTTCAAGWLNRMKVWVSKSSPASRCQKPSLKTARSKASLPAIGAWPVMVRQSHYASLTTTPSVAFEGASNLSITNGSWPGIISSGELAISVIISKASNISPTWRTIGKGRDSCRLA